MKKQKMSVTGLANIGALLERADKPAPAEKKSARYDLAAAVEKTTDKLTYSSVEIAPEIQRTHAANCKIVHAGMRDAFNAGHAQALAQSNAVDVLLERQYAARTMHITPAIVASVMEQLGLSNMVLDMRLVGTVFERNALDFSVADLGDRQVVDYTMAPIEGAETIAAPEYAAALATVGDDAVKVAVEEVIKVKKPRAPRKPKAPIVHDDL